MEVSKMHELEKTIIAVPELPENHLAIYSRLWQFEIWLRHMVYVELCAKYGEDWSNHLEGNSTYAKTSDESLTHMHAPEKMDLSYVTFGALTKTITKEWDLFSCYLPKQSIWNARIEEVSQIRNRVAHFRRGNDDDFPRVIQLLRDVDQGFFKFCTSLNRSLYPLSTDRNDPIICYFSPLNPYVGRDPSIAPNSIYDHFANSFEIKFEIISRPWSKIPKDYSEVIGLPGYFYELNLHCHDGRIVRYTDLLKATGFLHESLLYFVLSSEEDHLRVILPSILGKDILIKCFDVFIKVFANNLWPQREERSLSDEAMQADMDRVQRFADSCPEFVIGPKNPLSFLEPDMGCSFFNV